MCGRYGRRADKQRIAEWFHTHNTDVFNDEYYVINSTRLAPSYNISPESIQPAVRLDRDTGKRVLALMKWGLVPYWILLANSVTSPIGQVGQRSRCAFVRVELRSSDRLDAGG